ncbi:UDP-galactose 4-epimerase [Novosphingobium kunmingense]|uniref:UDP-glucose 4-epimerase n=1 Tax=Novosphingobium kunmingense TaxID=1211806 RepID=A0A2N0H3H0_9SPHN|nr:UDP-glucose 4-epimerase GalE [Novosphingobium kunmingense]PKB13469.1 UDP-galactose 4-epimerase [Novosphingobium kunmingense]
MRILLTGGTGFIGSHTAVALVAAGHEVVCFDNLSNSRAEVATRLEAITGRPVPLVIGDIRNRADLHSALTEHLPDAVIHFAGLKAVGESAAHPRVYYDNNFGGTLTLVEAMEACSVKRLVFSSSATVYGQPQYLPLDEQHPRAASNPYGRTKLMIEDMLSDIAAADPTWRVALLRYFNPAGAHDSGLIGEDPSGTPNNLLPYITRVAAGRLGELSVFGGDYDTADGTGVRDYIHVMDLAAGHLAALETIDQRAGGVSTWNLGTGRGFSVLGLISTFERVNGVQVPYRIVGRRPGDVASCYASVAKAENELGWRAAFGLEEMCRSAAHFENGRGTSEAR